MAWYTEGPKSNPQANIVLADTSALAGGNKTIVLIADCNVSGDVLLEHRDSTNTSTLNSQQMSIMANSPFTFTLPYGTLTFATDERLRVLTKSAISMGSVQASLFIG